MRLDEKNYFYLTILLSPGYKIIGKNKPMGKIIPHIRFILLNIIIIILKLVYNNDLMVLKILINKFVKDLCLNSIELGLNLEKLFLRSNKIKIHEVSQFNFKKHFQE